MFLQGFNKVYFKFAIVAMATKFVFFNFGRFFWMVRSKMLKNE